MTVAAAKRHLIENYFRPLKEFKRIATRSDKADDSDRAMIARGTSPDR